MAMSIGHVHIKTYDPKKTAQFYIDNFGATMKNEAPNGNIQLDLHGLQLNVTTISAAQNRKQMMGIEHIPLQNDDYASAIAKLRSDGAHVMLEQVSDGRHVAFIDAPDGAQMELIEKAGRPKRPGLHPHPPIACAMGPSLSRDTGEGHCKPPLSLAPL